MRTKLRIYKGIKNTSDILKRSAEANLFLFVRFVYSRISDFQIFQTKLRFTIPDQRLVLLNLSSEKNPWLWLNFIAPVGM